jgi:uncharacterized protein (UPF0332 family)
VREETKAYLDKARELLDKAEKIFGVNDFEDAARSAYMAGFHAAQALLFETYGRIYKTHNGVRTVFARLVKDDTRVDDQIRAFLGRTYNFKHIADYLIGPGSHITAEMAREAVDNARQFVERIAELTEHLQDRTPRQTPRTPP